MRYLLMSGMLVVAVAFTGCSKKEPSASDSASVVSLDAKYTEALVGHWKAVNSVTQTESGVTVVVSDLSAVYFSGGTSSGTGKMELVAAGIPDDLKKFRIKADGTWQVTDGVLRESMTNLSISPLVISTVGAQTGKAMAEQMKAMPTTNSQIISLDKDKLIVKELESGIIIEFRRQ